MKYLYFLCLILILHTGNITAQQVDTTRESINYRRTDPNSQPPTSYYQLPKEQVFPLGWNKGTLGKVTGGTGVWTELNPKVPRVNYIGLHFVNKDTGWAVGGSGAIIKTTNGGDDWTIAETPVNNLLLKTHSYNGEVVIVTGYDGIILRSSDGGETFEQVPSGVGSGTDLWGVQMLNDTLGWVSGMNQTLLKTTDAGITWQFVTPGLNQHYWSLDFLNEQYGIIAAGGGKVLKTTDGGNNWQQYQAGDTRALYTIDIIDSLHIAAAGLYGKNVYSSDGGVTWISNPNLPNFSATNWIEFIDIDTGYSVQDVYQIRKTTNRGQSWFNPNTTNLGGEWHIQLLEDGTGYSCGEEIGGPYALNFYKRTNGLDNWSKIFLNDNFYDVHFITENTGFVLSGALYKTNDGGINWERVINGPGGYDILFTDILTGYIVNNNSSIYKTTDGGGNWYLTNVPGTVGDVRKIFFINPTTGWAVTIWSPVSNAKILKTTDSGENWFVQAEDGIDAFTSIFFIDSLNGWATSRYVWQTTDGGENWIERTDIPAFFPNDVYFYNYLKGWVIAGNKLYYTSDGGENWTLDPQIYTYTTHFETISKTHFIITGTNIYESVDTGQVWQNITAEIGSFFTNLNAPKNYLAYGVGTTGYIVRYLDTSIVPVELSLFTGYAENKKVVLEWITSSEINNYGFNIERSFNNYSWENIGFVAGNGTTTKKNNYFFYDRLLKHIQFYRLKQIDYNGNWNYSNSIKITSDNIPKEYNLYQNYPNPFNPSTKIKYSIVKKGEVKLTIYDILGREVSVLVNEVKDPGYYEVNFNASNLASGVYFYRLVSGSFVSTRKMLLLK